MDRNAILCSDFIMMINGRMNWSVQSITELSTDYWKSCVLSAAVKLGVFDALTKGATAAEVAAATSSSERHMEELLGALESLRLVRKSRNVYRIEPSARTFLTRTGPTSLLDALQYNIDLYQLWGQLAECIRQGKPILPPTAHLGADPARTRRFAMGMHSRALAMAPHLLPAIDVRGCRSLLDIGSGPGTFSAMLAAKNRRLHVTMLDLGPVLDVARELVQSGPSADRVVFRNGDYRKDELPGEFDCAFYCGALHQEDPSTARALFKKIMECLVPGGRLFVVDMMLEKDRSDPLFSILFSLNMMLISPFGRVFTAKEVTGCLKDVGFKGIKLAEPSGCPYWVIKAFKPDA